MIGLRKLCIIVPGIAAAFVGITCAPIDPPAKEEAAVTPAVAPPMPAKEALAPPVASQSGLRERVLLAIEQVRKRDLLTTNGFWTIFHGILGLGPSVTLRNPDTGERVNAVDYICAGGKLRGLLFLPTTDGLDVQMGPQFVGQGHQDQFVAEMAEWDMKPDRKFAGPGDGYTFRDFINQSKMRARTTSDQELSWAIVVIGQYFGTNAAWTNSYDEKLTYDDVVRYELNQDVEHAACGGTHRLFGLTYAHHLHLREGGKTKGIWQDVVAKEQKYYQIAKKYQNADGSLSTEFFRGPGNSADKQLRMNSSGHILEWLALSLPDEELRQPWVESAVNQLALMFFEIQDQQMEGGTLYHAVHGLLMYYARVIDPKDLGPNAPHMPLGAVPRPKSQS